MKKLFIICCGLYLIACTPVKKQPDQFLSISTNPSGRGQSFELEMKKGKTFSHPLLAIWVENESGEYIQTIYVSQCIAKGMYGFGDKSDGQWKPGSLRRPAALPYWAKKRNVMESDGLFIPKPETAMPDAYTGPTPQKSFMLSTRLDSMLNKPFRVGFEINQAFDFNQTWTNNLFPLNDNYKTSGQPALVYLTELIDPNNLMPEYEFQLVGHSDAKGNTGELFTDLSSITSAKQIVEHICLKFKAK